MTPTGLDYDQIVYRLDAFEEERRSDPRVRWSDYLPPANSPHYDEAAAELVRLDLEYSWTEGTPKPLDAYRSTVPTLFARPDLLVGAAYEEYRQRRLVGHSVQPEEYARRFALDTADWPILAASPAAAAIDPSDESQQSVLLREGDDFAGFRLISLLGEGTFAKVFLAAQRELDDRPVVLKISTLHSLEPQHLARLQHTNIVPIYSVHQWRGLVGVCMPYLGARTLADLMHATAKTGSLPASGEAFLSTVPIRQEATMPAPGAVPETSPLTTIESSGPGNSSGPPTQNYTDAVLALVDAVAAAVGHAHARGIVHRDVKPANILITDEGRPMLLDFNLSDDLVVNGREALAAGGTLPYMAPEHLRAVQNGGRVDARSDIYSLGVVLFELLTGERPYPLRRGPLDHVLTGMLDDRLQEPVAVRTLNRAVPPSIGALVAKCLSGDVRQRYQSIEALRDDLRCHFEHRPLHHASNPSLRERAAKWTKRHPRLASATSLASLLSIAAAIMAVVWLSRERHVAGLEADHHYHEFRDTIPQVRAALSVADSDRQLIARGLDEINRVIAQYQPQAPNWRDADAYRYLSADAQREVDQRLLELAYLQARGELLLKSHAEHTAKQHEHHQRAVAAHALAVDLLPPGMHSAALDQQERTLSGISDTANEAPIGRNQASEIDRWLLPQALVAQRQFDQAIAALQTSIDDNPHDPALWLLLGNAQVATGDLAAAEGSYRTAVAMQPESVLAHYNRGLCHLESRDYAAAVPDFTTVLQLWAECIAARLNRALAYEGAAQLDLALADLNTALLNPECPTRAWFIRSRLHARMGDSAAAAADRLAGIERLPTDELSWVARGIALLETNPEAALADFRSALKLNPVSRIALQNVVHVTADRLNRRDEALAALDQILTLSPGDAEALLGRAVLRARAGNRAGALADVNQAIKQSQRPIDLLQAACVLSQSAQLDAKDVSLGMALLTRALTGDPSLLSRADQDSDLTNLRASEQYLQLRTLLGELSEMKAAAETTSLPDGATAEAERGLDLALPASTP